MAEQQTKRRPSYSLRIDEEKKSYIDNTLNNISKQKSIDKGDALFIIVRQYNDTQKERLNVDYSKIKPWECNFLNYQDEQWECLELMGTSKKPIPLGIDIESVRPKCKACFESHQFTENERLKRLLERGNITKLSEFYKEFLRLTKQGFDANCIMCRGALLEKNSVIISRDAEMLYCPLQNMDIVNIKETCLEVIDPSNKTKGCQFLIQFKHHVAYKNSDAEERIKEILPQLNKLENEKENE